MNLWMNLLCYFVVDVTLIACLNIVNTKTAKSFTQVMCTNKTNYLFVGVCMSAYLCVIANKTYRTLKFEKFSADSPR